MEQSRRTFIKQVGYIGGTIFFRDATALPVGSKKKSPNLIYVFADQWRAEAVGYAGNKDVITPCLDSLAKECLCFEYAISNIPVSTPYRGSMLTGQYPQTTGLFLNDVQLNPNANSIAKSYKASGYDTAYIGKWHVNGNGRTKYIPKSCRQGFDYFKVMECTHSYLSSKYYDNDDSVVKEWNNYDAIEQTIDAQNYIKKQTHKEKPFVLFLSWGPPHNPYTVVPQKFLDLYKNKTISLRPNVPEEAKDKAILDLKGYYAHIAALDECIGLLQKTIKEQGIENDTIFVFTSDHGDMIGSQGLQRKQKPYDESIRVPFLLKYPAIFGFEGKKVNTILNTVDIMPTLLGLSGIKIPETVEGKDLSFILKGEEVDSTEAALISCIAPFGEWSQNRGGREYRGIRTRRYTYVVDLNGPWLLFDNKKDPYQQRNLTNEPSYSSLIVKLEKILKEKLKKEKDEFLTGKEYINKWGYIVDKTGTVSES